MIGTSTKASTRVRALAGVTTAGSGERRTRRLDAERLAERAAYLESICSDAGFGLRLVIETNHQNDPDFPDDLRRIEVGREAATEPAWRVLSRIAPDMLERREALGPLVDHARLASLNRASLVLTEIARICRVTGAKLYYFMEPVWCDPRNGFPPPVAFATDAQPEGCDVRETRRRIKHCIAMRS